LFDNSATFDNQCNCPITEFKLVQEANSENAISDLYSTWVVLDETDPDLLKVTWRTEYVISFSVMAKTEYGNKGWVNFEVYFFDPTEVEVPTFLNSPPSFEEEVPSEITVPKIKEPREEPWEFNYTSPHAEDAEGDEVTF